jgi:hypothetical protein
LPVYQDLTNEQVELVINTVINSVEKIILWFVFSI